MPGAILPTSCASVTQWQSGAVPPIITVAVTLLSFGRPVVSTVMLGVPCPDDIVPAESVQLYVSPSPPLTFAVNVIGLPGVVTPEGPVTVNVGQTHAT